MVHQHREGPVAVVEGAKTIWGASHAPGRDAVVLKSDLIAGREKGIEGDLGVELGGRWVRVDGDQVRRFRTGRPGVRGQDVLLWW